MTGATDSRTYVAVLRRLRDPDDPEAWNAFVDRYTPRVYGWCRRHQLPESDAADATQELMRRLILAIRHFQYDPSKSSYREWLKAVAAKTVRRLLRAARSPRGSSGNSRVLQALSSINDPAAESDLARQIDEAYEKELLREASLRVQLRVEPQVWEAYRLAAIEKVEPVEVAQRLHLTTDDVGAAKSRVVKMLREEMKKLDAS
jgi:RNA polymerase sigma-70 factor (ECF subfamily)